MLSDQRIRELLEAAPDAIIQVDERGHIILLNRVTEQMFGYSREELLGKPVELLIPEDLRARHTTHREAYERHPTTRAMGIGMTLEGQRKNGSTFPVEISLSPSSSEEGFRVTAIIRDTTERKLTEERMRTVQEEYMRELELRNREIERANRLKSEFLASMSHELRTPLHTIIGFSELLGEQLQGPLNDKQLRFIHHIHRDSLHLLELINDILDLSKIESGRLELRPEVFVFGDVVKDSLNSVRTQANTKSIKLESSVSVPEAVEADRLRVKQILVNLLSNAVKFTPDGGRVRVQAASDSDFVTVSVADTGVGIPKEEQQAVFDKFHQVGNTTKGVREGTGLGLAITKNLVESHGGTIELESEPGRGTRFTFTLPLRQGQRTGTHEKSAGG